MTFSEQELLAAKQLLERIRAASEYVEVKRPDHAQTGPENEPAELSGTTQRAALVEKATIVLFNRRHRARLFAKGMFGEPAWEMLLVLYVADESETRHTIGSLIEAAGVTMTTALRWLDFLEAEGLIQRTDHPTDRRAVFIGLSDAGRQALDVYFSGVR